MHLVGVGMKTSVEEQIRGIVTQIYLNKFYLRYGDIFTRLAVEVQTKTVNAAGVVIKIYRVGVRTGFGIKLKHISIVVIRASGSSSITQLNL